MYKDKPCEKCADWGTCHSDDFRDRHWLKSHGKADCWKIGEINDNNTLIFPQTIGDITYYNKEELFEWVEKQQEFHKTLQVFKIDTVDFKTDEV